MTAFIAAFVTSLSRIIDYQHRGTDVIGGSLLGEFMFKIKGYVLRPARRMAHLKPSPGAG